MNKEKINKMDITDFLEVDGCIYGGYTAEELGKVFIEALEEKGIYFIGLTKEMEE